MPRFYKIKRGLAMLFRFIVLHYLKYFCIIFSALELFFVTIDTLQYIDKLPDSANLLVLYIFYDCVYAMSYTLPISLALSAIIFLINLLKTNQLTALLALGYSRLRILSPVVAMCVFFTCAHIGLNCTPLAYALEQVELIVHNQTLVNVRTDVLLKFDDKYIYMGKIFPLEDGGARVENIKIFELDSLDLRQHYSAKSGVFVNNQWRLSDVDLVSISPQLKIGSKAIDKQEIARLELLKGFRPKVLDTFAKDKPRVSIIDAIDTLRISIKQGTSSTKMRGIIYALAIAPFFVPLSILIIASFIPSLARYENLAILGFSCVLGVLMVWGLFFSFAEFSTAGLIQPEMGVLAPFLILLGFTLHFLRKINTKFI